LKTRDDATIRNIISQGQPNFGMSPFEDVNGGQLSTDEIDALVAFIRSWEANPPADLPPQAPPASTPTPVAPAEQPSSGTPGSFSEQVLPIFQAKCAMCHNAQTTLGGWDATSYESVMTSGANGPVVVAGDTANSILAQLILGKQGLMPPSGQLPENELQSILYWIAAGAPDN
jgi:mono/diheme cytochrome c family protein